MLQGQGKYEVAEEIHHLALALDSPEILSMRSNKRTSGILSIKDGPKENPWQTMVWPLAKDSPTLYHALYTLTAFHGAKDIPQLEISGVDHRRRCLRTLARGIGNMRVDVALATTLVLAFSETCNLDLCIGMQHLPGL